jgi:transcriptional regulator with XRE-family HTH domain
MHSLALGWLLVKSSCIFGDVTNQNAPQSASDVVGERLRDLRKSRRMSVEDLAAQCKETGSPELTANAIYAIENGRKKGGVRTRHVTVDELLALGCALDVSPLALLMPTDPGGYPVVSNREVGSDRVFDWLIGSLDSPFSDDQAAMDQYPSGLPEWLVERQRKLDAEWDAERAEQMSTLSDLRARSTTLLAEVEQAAVELERKSAKSDAALSTLDELRTRYVAQLAELEQKAADLDAAMSAVEATDPNGDGFMQRVTEMVREALESIQKERPADD